MNDLFISILFGHIAGDFFFQPKSMAIKKGTSNLVAFYHVCIYTGMVILFTFSFVPDYLSRIIWAFIIFMPHYVIDRYSLADKWLKLINGRSLEDFLQNGHKNIQENLTIEEKLNYQMLRASFSGIVYVIIDGTLHLFCLYYGYKLLNIIQ